MRNHSGPYRIELDIAHATEQIALATHHARLESSGPKMSGALEPGVDTLDIQAIEVLHQSTERARHAWRQQKMYVVGHQAPAMNTHLQMARIGAQQVQIFQIALMIEEYGLSV